MGETSNTADLAEIISQRIFSKFYWERLGQKNINWECVKPGHDRKTHPSDAVFHYESPYEKERIYINFDLKSYKNTSIENKTN
ncbi:MAG: hypothetical protein PQJ44_00945, partial [Sphaerochaetaceae bacterium]|nr:hypothetical protein [Sphaerochaetaceae bacterium]